MDFREKWMVALAERLRVGGEVEVSMREPWALRYVEEMEAAGRLKIMRVDRGVIVCQAEVLAPADSSAP